MGGLEAPTRLDFCDLSDVLWSSTNAPAAKVNSILQLSNPCWGRLCGQYSLCPPPRPSSPALLAKTPIRTGILSFMHV
jgi:hypothetical protein